MNTASMTLSDIVYLIGDSLKDTHPINNSLFVRERAFSLVAKLALIAKI